MITVGLDFGTHQSKVCAEYKQGVELSYTISLPFHDLFPRQNSKKFFLIYLA